MNSTHYTLDWRGTRKGPLSYEDIEASLETGDLHSLYKINVDGKWLVLRDFLEQQRAAKNIALKHIPEPLTTSHVQPASPVKILAPPHPPPLPAQQANAPIKPSGAKVNWLLPSLIMAGTTLIILTAIVIYWMATRRSEPALNNSTSTKTVAKSSSSKKNSEKKTVDSNMAGLSGELTNEQVAEQKSPYVVKVSARWKAMNKSGVLEELGKNGSGVHIKNENGYSIFVTNRHVVEPPGNAKEIVFSMVFAGEEIPFEVIGLARYELDLAKLRLKHVQSANEMTLQVATIDDLKPGQECVAIGNALGAGISVTTGVISAFDDWSEGKLIRTSAPISSGNSGGGLFRKKDGCLIGITTMASRGSSTKAVQNFNLAIPIDYILSDLFWENTQP